VLFYFLIEGLVIIGFFSIFGWLGGVYFLVQSLVAMLLLETINYIEHYGLQRKVIDLEKNEYEPVNPTHSWNSSNRITNYFLFNLQRHSDHHFKPGRRYQILRHFETSPQLPTGYAGMVLLSFLPPLFFRVLEKRLISLTQSKEV
jgi:alkane 1-monooxygenase